MTSSVRIVLNSHRDDASTRACITGLHRRLRDAGVDATLNDWEHYERYAVAVFMAYDHEMDAARRANPRIRVALADPKQRDAAQMAAVRAADFVIAGGIEPRDVFYPHNRNVLALSMIPPMPPVERIHTDKTPIVIGYHGNRVHLECMFATVTPALNELGRRRPVEFWAVYNVDAVGRARIGMPDPSLVKVRHIQWTDDVAPHSEVSAVFYSELRHADIGIVPNLQPIRDRLDVLARAAFDEPEFAHEPFDHLLRFKASANAARVYPFARLGIPVVADFVPSAAQLIRDGESGFLVSSPSGWFEALDTLAASADLRNRFAQKLRGDVDAECDRQLRTFLDFCAGPLKAGAPPFAAASGIDEERAELGRYAAPRGPRGLQRIQRRLKRVVGR
jgi:glycosyltransferase involved in cell wall biosynthesis